MRWLFLLLLAANAAYFAWQSVQPPLTPQAISTAVADDDGLRLLSELGEEAMPPLRESLVQAPAAREASPAVIEEEAVSEASAKPSEPLVPAVRQCVRLSEIEKAETAERLAGELVAGGLRLEARGEESVPRQNYWVLLPPYPSRAQAEQVIRQLKASKLHDLYLIRSGESQNAISLGVFSSQELAERRYRQVAALKLGGKQPKMEVIELQAKRQWLEVSYPEGREPADWRSLLAIEPGLELNERRCAP